MSSFQVVKDLLSTDTDNEISSRYDQLSALHNYNFKENSLELKKVINPVFMHTAYSLAQTLSYKDTKKITMKRKA